MSGQIAQWWKSYMQNFSMETWQQMATCKT